MKHSIKKQFALSYSLLLAVVIAICWLANSLLLGDFYIRDKKASIMKAYEQIDESCQSGDIQSEEFRVSFYQIAARGNLDILILDSDTKIIMSTVLDNQGLSDRLLGYFLRGTDKAESLYQSEKFYVQRSFDTLMKMEYIELWGLLSNNNMIVMRTPVESIRDSVRISNRFLGYVGGTVIIIGVIFAILIAKKVTGPILKLAEISDKMARLDFDAKYDDNGKEDEVALLGRSMNVLSHRLESTISELKTANNELEADLAHKIELDNMRKEFLSNVSHELKTPIALIQGYAEGLKDCVNDDEESRNYYCDVIIDESDKMNNMVQQLLKLNQLESGQDTVSFERFDLTELMKECIRQVDILLKQNDISMRFYEENPVYVWSDRSKIEQVINNYLSNAIHYASQERVIEVTFEPHCDRMRIKIFNSGDPIPEEALEHLWVKFYKVDKARTREYGGTGIGLSIVKAIGESLNSEYGVSNYDNGVCFWFDVECNKIGEEEIHSGEL